jgi:hypothetical protein
MLGNNINNGNFDNSIIIGNDAVACNNAEVVIGSLSNPVGVITSETCTSSKTWQLRVNGCVVKVLLA